MGIVNNKVCLDCVDDYHMVILAKGNVDDEIMRLK